MELKLFQSDPKVWANYCREDFRSVSGTLTCWLFISVLTQGFLGILVTAHFAVYDFGNKSALTLIFFSNCWIFDVDFRNLEKNRENISGFGDNCVWIGCFKQSLLPRGNMRHQESISYQTVSRFQMLLRQDFSNWKCFNAIEK